MICCVDTSNIFFIIWSMFKKDCLQKNGEDYVIKEEDLGLFYHMFLRKIMPFITTYKDCVFCFEGLHSTKWRKEIFPPYKENRKDRAEDPNYKWVGPMMEKMLEYLSHFHCKILKVENCEGDDCIYQTCKYYVEKGESVRIISTDKDLSQIMNFYPENVSQYNPVKQENVDKNKNILLEKALVGDTSDNIKAFKGLGPKTFEKMMEDQDFWNKKMTPSNLQMLDVVMKIIDLRQYPQEYQNNIVKELDKPWNEFDKDSVEKFLLDNGLKACYSDWTSNWSNEIEAQSFEQEDAMDEINQILNGEV